MSDNRPAPHAAERENTALLTSSVDDAWTDLATLETHRDAVNLIDQATLDERQRCKDIIIAEASKGKAAGIPSSSGVMVLLARIAAAIENG